MNKKTKYGYMALVLLLLAIIGQYWYFSGKISNKDTLIGIVEAQFNTVKDEFQVEEHNQVDFMNREIIQSEYDLSQLRGHRNDARKKINNPSDKILNPQNYYTIENGVVVEITRE